MIRLVLWSLMLSLLPGQVFAQEQKMSQESDWSEFAAAYTAAWNSGDPAQVAAHYAVDGVLTINGGEPAGGRPAVLEVVRGFMESFPDMVLINDRLESAAGRVNYHWTFIGTNTGPGGTGRPVRFSGFESWIFTEQGLIQDSLGSFDQADYDRQLGLL